MICNFRQLLAIALMIFLASCIYHAEVTKKMHVGQPTTPVASVYNYEDSVGQIELSHEHFRFAGNFKIPFFSYFRCCDIVPNNKHLGQDSSGLFADSVEGGHISHYTLPNKTSFWLNCCSKIAFDPTKGEIELNGNGIFDFPSQETTLNVGKEAKIICSKGTRISFTTDLQPDDQSNYISLLKGKVKFIIGHDGDTLTKPGDQFIVSKSISQNHIYGWGRTSIDTSEVTAWLRGSFDHKHVNDKDLVYRIANWFEKIVIDSVGEEHLIHFKGRYSDPLPTLIDRLNKEDTAIHFTVVHDKIILTRRNQ